MGMGMAVPTALFVPLRQRIATQCRAGQQIRCAL
jgi:hypothetical protein